MENYIKDLELQMLAFEKRLYEVDKTNRNRALKIARAIVDIEDILKNVKKKYKNDNKLIEKLEFLLQILRGDTDE